MPGLRDRKIKRCATSRRQPLASSLLRLNRPQGEQLRARPSTQHCAAAINNYIQYCNTAPPQHCASERTSESLTLAIKPAPNLAPKPTHHAVLPRPHRYRAPHRTDTVRLRRRGIRRGVTPTPSTTAKRSVRGVGITPQSKMISYICTQKTNLHHTYRRQSVYCPVFTLDIMISL